MCLCWDGVGIGDSWHVYPPAFLVASSANFQSPVVSSSYRPFNPIVCSPAARSKTPDHEDTPADRSFSSLLTVPTHHHVLKALRNAWAGVVMDVLNQIVSMPSDITAWIKFFNDS